MALGTVIVSSLRAADDPVVLLPPLEVAAKLQTTPWRYASVGGVEILSSCSEPTTRLFIEREHRLDQLFALLVPPEFQVRMSVPKIIVLTNQKQTLSASQELVANSTGPAPAAPLRSKGGTPPGAVRFMPNLRLSDFDSVAVYAMIVEGRFNPTQIGLSPEFVHFVLEHRSPPLPAWVVEGFTGVISQAGFGNFTVGVPPIAWGSAAEREKLKADPDYPRVLLPMRELFESTPAPGAAPENVQRWRAQAALFVRWMLEGDEAREKSFWAFVTRGATGPVTEAIFRECFGLGYADARDALSDFLPGAIQQPIRIQRENLPPVPSYRLRIATDAEVARIKGEWERLVVTFVKAQHPEFRARYEEQAVRTLGEPMTGPRDPRLLAVQGLYAADNGRDQEAASLLEAAATAKVVRPRAYLELARLRSTEALSHPAGADGRLSAAQANAVLEPLRLARTQQPPLAQTYALAAEVWRSSEVALSAQQYELLDEGLRLFPNQIALVYQIAALKLQHGAKAEAMVLVERGLRQSPTPAARAA
ncbi:MAG TPA: hypothetical protein VL475_15290, partial [Planctomycetaceae bacterium]|nr:hypothetical protein [Planctomycetaceae bacterium]